MLHPPLSVIVTWPTSNYDDPVTRGPGRIVLASIFTFLMCFVVVLRFYTRLVLIKNVGRDDGLIAIATITSTGFNLLLILNDATITSIRHIWDIPLDKGPPLLKVMMAGEILYGVSSTLVKASLLAMIRRLLANSNQKLLIRFVLVCDVLNLAAGISWTFVAVFQCRPVSALWTIFPTVTYTCISGSLELLFASFITVIDFLVLALPINIIWRLQLPRRQRRTIIALLSLSVLACIAGVIRNVYISYSLASYDLLWTSWQYSLASIVEIDLAVICASIPALWPLVTYHFPRLSHSMQRSKSTPRPNPNLQPNFIRIHTPVEDYNLDVISPPIKQSSPDWSISSVPEEHA